MNSRLLNVGDRFRTKFYRTDGLEFYGQMLDIPDTSRVTNFLSSRRYLRVRPESVIESTNVIIAGGVKFIVADHGTGFHFGPIYKHFKLFQVDKIVPWYKNSKIEDSITGIKKMERTLQASSIYLSLQPKSNIEDSIHIQQQTHVAITNAAVSRDDIVDNMIVTKVDNVLGVYLIELKEQ